MTHGRSGNSVVLNGQDDPRVKQINYVDRYRRARLAVRHHPVLTAEGKVEPLVSGQLPNDPHEFIGQRLPDEVLFYMSRGLINSRILTWRATSEIVEAPPIDGGESAEYRALVSAKLTELRTTAINLLSSSLHNWYQHKDIDLKCWFQGDQSTTVSMKALPEFRKIVDTWNVKEATFKDVVAKHQVTPTRSMFLACADCSEMWVFGGGSVGSRRFGLCLKVCVEEGYQQGKSTRPVIVTAANFLQPLETTDEKLMNSIWRFLALRDYVDTNHNLTNWGKVLAASFKAIGEQSDLQEGVVVAVELIRLGSLNWDLEMFPYEGAPIRGESESPLNVSN